MTKAEWISVIKNTLMKVDEQGRYRDALLERHIQSVYEQMHNESYAKSRRGAWKYVRKYTETMSSETDLSGGYVLANQPISLSRPSSGLFKVKSTGAEFIMTDAMGVDDVIDDSFDTASFKGKYVATMLSDKLYGNATIANEVDLDYWIIPKFTTLSDSDEVMIPDGMEDHFIDRVIMTVQQMPPTDLINDNTI